jgi:hypothetical protein
VNLRNLVKVGGVCILLVVLAGCYSIGAIPEGQVDLDASPTRHPMPVDVCPSPNTECCGVLNLPDGLIVQYPAEMVSDVDRLHPRAARYTKRASPGFTVETWWENAWDASYKQRGCRGHKDVWWYYRNGRKTREVTRTISSRGGVVISRSAWQPGWK